MAYNPSVKADRDALYDEVRLAAHSANMAAGNHQAIADALNVPQGAISVWRGIRSSREVMSAIEGTEFAALAAGPRDYLIALVSPGEVDFDSQPVREALVAAFSTTSLTRPRLVALALKTPASRAEQLFGVDTVLTGTNIAGVAY